MRRRRPHPRTLITAALLVLAGIGVGLAAEGRAHGRAAPAGEPVPGAHPNIVFVLTDDLSWDLLPYMPQVRRLERDGVTFRQFIVADSLCCSSRATIFTGEFPHNTGVLGNVPPLGGYQAFRRHGDLARSVAIPLHRAGYRTGLFGKYLNDYHPFRGGQDPGWDEWLASSYAYSGFGYEQSDDGRAEFDGYSPRDYVTDVLSRRAVAFIRSTAGRQPFFAMVSTYAPHKPFVPAPRDRFLFPRLRPPRSAAFDAPSTHPPAWLGHRPPLTAHQKRVLTRDFRMRARSVQAVDDMIGRIRATLRATGTARDTYIVFTSDNGFHLGQHRLTAGKRTAFDEDVRVPMIIVGPHVAQGRRTSAMTGTVDLAPTFEHWAGLPADGSRDGRSLAPLLDGRAPAGWRHALLVEHDDDGVATGDPDAQGWAQGRPTTYAALRTRWSTYVQYAAGDTEFYDRRRDPAELHNIADRLGPARLAGLRAALARYRACRGEQACFAAGRVPASLMRPGRAG